MAVTSFSRVETNVHEDVDCTDTGEVIASSPATLFAVRVDASENPGEAVYFKIYDKATAATASDIPTSFIKVPASGTREWRPNGALGASYGVGISIRCVQEGGTAGTTDPTGTVAAIVHTS